MELLHEHQEHADIFREVEHIGIAVPDLEAANKIYQAMLGVPMYKIEEVPSEGVRTAFYRVGRTKIELLEPTNSDGPVARFLEKKGPGIHHIAFDVEDIVRSMERLRGSGFILTRDEPVHGADNKLVCFVHPKSMDGTLIELCQDRDKGKSSPSNP
jgi:methylmalonyl-CoA/ethylmalonyl-CoA epimerase